MKITKSQLKRIIREEKRSVIAERFTSSQIKKAIKIAEKMSGDMTGASKKIERIKRGLTKDPKVADALRSANESISEAKHSMSDKELYDYLIYMRKYKPSVYKDMVKNREIKKLLNKFESVSEAQLRKSIREELYNPQSNDAEFKNGIRVKNVWAGCPHYKSEGVVIKAGNAEVTYIVDNVGPTYQPGDELTKTKEQLIPLNSENITSLEEGASSAQVKRIAFAVVNELYKTAYLRNKGKKVMKLVAEVLRNKLTKPTT